MSWLARSLARGAPLLRQVKPKTQLRSASYQRFPGRGGQQYSRFGPAARAQYLWYNYRPVVVGGGTAGGVFYVYNLETVPITGRRRFNCLSQSAEKALLGDSGYQQVLQEFQGKILPENHPYTQQVARVVERLLPSAGNLAGDQWVVHVIDEPKEMNAFVMPGGKVFVFTGILPICQDEDGVAAVLGHEIAHNVAHHAAERLSRNIFVLFAALVLSMVFDISGGSSKFIVDLFGTLPNSRVQEAEADYIGLLMMAESCFDPNGVPAFWKRMAQAEKGAPPQFLSTHPSSKSRVQLIERWLPEAAVKYHDSQCGITSSYAREFRKAFESPSIPAGPFATPIGRPRGEEDDDLF
jgi:metalloendopeptidase OMA1, mitochondrial